MRLHSSEMAGADGVLPEWEVEDEIEVVEVAAGAIPQQPQGAQQPQAGGQDDVFIPPPMELRSGRQVTIPIVDTVESSLQLRETLERDSRERL